MIIRFINLFLFFAYAPISVSELGQTFENTASEEVEREKMTERIEMLEKRLGIELGEADE